MSIAVEDLEDPKVACALNAGDSIGRLGEAPADPETITDPYAIDLLIAKVILGL